MNKFELAVIKAEMLKECYDAINQKKSWNVCFKMNDDGEATNEPYDEREEEKVRVFDEVLRMIEKML